MVVGYWLLVVGIGNEKTTEILSGIFQQPITNNQQLN
jgi:hypothetical protein